MLTFNHLIIILILIKFSSFNLVNAANSRTKFLRFESEPESAYAELNKKVNLKCSVEPEKGSRIQWLINGEPVRIDDREISTTVDSLIIQLPQRTDQNVGRYTFDELVNSEIQCRAEYRNQVLLSQPAKITVAFLNDFPYSEDEIKVDVKEQQIAVIPCKPPNSPPRVVTSFAFKNKIIESNDEKYHLMPSGNLQIFNVSMEDSGLYQCIAYNPWLKEKKNSSNYVTLHIEKRFNNEDKLINQDKFVIEKLNFLSTPKQKYSVIRGTDVQIFECVASSILPVNISWYRENGKPLPKNRSKIVGGNLVINNVQTIDQGNYYCEATNGHKTITATSELEVKQSASIKNDLESKQVQIGEQVEFECSYSGYPTPKLSWFLNGLKLTNSNSDYLDIKIDQINDERSRLVIKKANKQHNGIIQCFASNDLSTVYSVARLNVVKELNNNDNISPNRPNKPRRRKPNRNRQSDMAVPDKPKIIRLSFDSVIVHWKMPKKNRLPITFFKIQYKDLHQYNNKTDWITVEEDIPPNINSYSITNLQTDKFYKFRIMAVYKNQDSEDGKVSDRFFLAKNPIYKRPSSIPQKVQGKSDNSNSIQIYWEIEFLEDEQVEGFLIHYRPTQSAEIFNKITIDNNQTRKYLIENLAQSKQYDIKIQTFNLAGVSDFSKTETVRTLSALVGPEDDSIGDISGEEVDEVPDPDQNSQDTKIQKEDEHHHDKVDSLEDTKDINKSSHPTEHVIEPNMPTNHESPDNHIDLPKKDNNSTTQLTNEDILRLNKNVNPLSTESPLFYVIVAIIILINFIILVYCYSIVKRWINRNKDNKSKSDDKFDLDDENFILKPGEEDSMSRSFTKMNVFNDPLYSSSSNGGILSTNPHLTRKAIKNYNHNYATIGHSKNMFNKSDVYDSSLMNVRVNKFCDDSIANSLLAINKAGNHQINKRDLPNHRMSTTISHHNLTRPNLANNHPHSTIYGNHHTIHNNVPNKNLDFLPESNLKAINTLGRNRPTTRNFEELYGTNTRFATINRSNSIARLNNGTLERNKRKTRESRNDLFTVLNIREENEPTTIVDLQQSPNLDFRTLKSVRYVNNLTNNINGNIMNGSALNGMTSITNLNYNGIESIYNNHNNLNNSSLNSNNSNLITNQNNMDNSMNNYEQLVQNNVQNSPRSAYSMQQQQNLASNSTPTQLTNNRPIVKMMQSSC